jgi:hypothetical protein
MGKEYRSKVRGGSMLLDLGLRLLYTKLPIEHHGRFQNILHLLGFSILFHDLPECSTMFSILL